MGVLRDACFILVAGSRPLAPHPALLYRCRLYANDDRPEHSDDHIGAMLPVPTEDKFGADAHIVFSVVLLAAAVFACRPRRFRLTTYVFCVTIYAKYVTHLSSLPFFRLFARKSWPRRYCLPKGLGIFPNWQRT